MPLEGIGTARDSLAVVARAARSAPATWILSLIIGIVAARFAYTRTLLSPGRAWAGPLLVAALCVLFYWLLILTYGSLVRTHEDSAQRLSRRIGIALVLALVSTRFVRIAMSPMLEPLGWGEFYYLRLLIPLALATLWCTALLPQETRALARGVRRREAIVVVLPLACLLLLAAVLVSGTDLSFQLVRSGSSVQEQLGAHVMAPRAWAGTTIILFVVLTCVFAATSSVVAAALLVTPLYATMVFATVMKFRYIHAAVHPYDLLTIPEFLPLFGSFFGLGAIVGSVIGIALWIAAVVYAWRRMRHSVSPRRRGAMGVASLVLLGAVIGVFLPPNALPGPIAAHGEVLQAFTMKIDNTEGGLREMARTNGIVLNFLSELRSAFVTVPRDYSAQRVEHTLATYGSRGAMPAATKRAGGVNLVLYLVESLMDPDDLGMHYTADPMPNVHALSASQVHGRAIAPHEFSGSANTEFELLTGMTNAFLPAGSIPYRQYLRRPMPALPRALHEFGYTTTAVQAGHRYYYDRERVYPLLGFDHTVWLHDEPVRDRADRGRWPSDESIVDAVIEASQRSRPFFVFAFPAALHSPYDFGTYARSDLDVLDAPSPLAAAEVKEYVNAVRVADRAIGRLVEHFRHSPDSTVVVVMGDHLPPLSSEAMRVFTRRIERLPTAERARAARAVPLLVWANFALPPEEISLSMNMVPAYLLERLGEPREGLFAVTDSLRRALPVVGKVVQDTAGRLHAETDIPPSLRGAIEDYRLVQYDLLLGGQFAYRRR